MRSNQKRQFLPSVIGLASFLLGAGLVPAQEPPVRNPLVEQAARAVSVTSKGKKVYYDYKFDLSALPRYVPGKQVSGHIRMWGLNYITDSNLAQYWEDGFKKFHPRVTFEYQTPTALVAIPGLIAGVADIGANTKTWLWQRREWEGIFGYELKQIRMVTGSFNVAGWANALGFFVHKSNPLSKITPRQVDGIFGAERDGGWVRGQWNTEVARGPDKNIRTWGQMGLTGEWADKTIHTYGVNLRYHQSVGFSDKYLGGSDKWNEELRMYANIARPDGTLAIGAGLLMQDLSHDP
ncbi:MAG: hypothetical protein PHQ04_09240 [Opitutaceae bacterium]|nr:hypothetical protein [Opitutaceae bacterium]